METRLPNGNIVETWYDRQSRNYITQGMNANREQQGDALFAGERIGSAHNHDEMVQKMGGGRRLPQPLEFDKWRVNGSTESTAIWVEDNRGRRVCTVKNHELDLAAARLIAAAPKLKAALETLAADAAIASTLLRLIHKEGRTAGALDEAIAMASAALRMANFGAPDEGRR